MQRQSRDEVEAALRAIEADDAPAAKSPISIQGEFDALQLRTREADPSAALATFLAKLGWPFQREVSWARGCGRLWLLAAGNT